MPPARVRRAPAPPVRHPLLERLANAPIDDEPLTIEDERDIRFAREEARRGKLIPHDQVVRELGTKRGRPKKRKPARS